ncbi:MAG TPA: hypothetical protein VES20_22375, partial [Bryobacteraceae bacterium]|nr:hypothetical protein [Bryobacteraceae bacterium]
MKTGLDPQSSSFLVNLERIRVRQENAQRAVSSGLRVSRPSDDPTSVIDIVQLRSESERASNVGAN